MPDIRTTTRGNAAGDVKKYVHADESVSATFRLAVNSQYLDRRTGEFVERDPEFLTVWVRGRLASNVLDSVNKGQPLIVSGRLSTSEYQDREGAKGFSLELQADAVAHDLNFGTSRYYKTIRETPSTGE
ncbi:MAG: single-stranded DNA-binding protein, partial [Brachybacterium sp.]|nr:single-stranded DNA-binding protein [Brachybacterium sp.]